MFLVYVFVDTEVVIEGGTRMSAVTFLENARIRPTPTRIAILEILLGARHPMSFREIKSRFPGRHDTATLDKTLSLLIEKGIAHQIQDIKGVWHLCLHSSSHAHFCCRICGRLTCLLETPLPQMEVKAGITLEGQYTVLYGICDSCGTQLVGLGKNESIPA
jgi:Fe2+ or Zn2+ uptake regulation protein